VFRRRVLVVSAFVGVLFLYRMDRVTRRPGTIELATATGTLRLPQPRAAAIQGALDYLSRHAQAEDTLAAFPEGGFFNFVTGLRSPLRQDLIVPGVLAGAREREATAQLATAGPRFILLANRPSPEFGPQSFGQDFAVDLWREVERDYRLVAVFGGAEARVGAPDFFLRVYERRPQAGRPALLPSTRFAPATAGPSRG
jgi:hypothetical protein